MISFTNLELSLIVDGSVVQALVSSLMVDGFVALAIVVVPVCELSVDMISL